MMQSKSNKVALVLVFLLQTNTVSNTAACLEWSWVDPAVDFPF